MTAEQCELASAAGGDIVASLPGNVVLLGEMGIGNTSAAALLLARLAGRDIAECAGAAPGSTMPACAASSMCCGAFSRATNRPSIRSLRWLRSADSRSR